MKEEGEGGEGEKKTQTHTHFDNFQTISSEQYNSAGSNCMVCFMRNHFRISLQQHKNRLHFLAAFILSLLMIA